METYEKNIRPKKREIKKKVPNTKEKEKRSKMKLKNETSEES
jgi:hypothetical protein